MSEAGGPLFVAGHRGMVGSALVRALRARGDDDLLLATRQDLDLTDQAAVHRYFAERRPARVILAAARVGGIHANDVRRADFIYENLLIQTNVIGAAWRHGVERLLFLGSSCIYPRLAPQPLAERALLTGALEPTNQPYAVAKIAGIEMCDAFRRQYGCDFRAAMPTNLYGPGDNFDRDTSHVIPALLRKFHEARQAAAPAVAVWGTGTPRREFLHVDDLARACLHLLDLPRARWDALGTAHVNVGSGSEVTIAELAEEVRGAVGYAGAVEWDRSKPDGTPRKLLDSSLMHALGWQPGIGLAQGLRATYAWFVEHAAARGPAVP